MVASVNQTRILFLDVNIHIINYVSVFCSIDLVLEVHDKGVTRIVVNSESFHQRVRDIIDSHQRFERVGR